MQPNAPVTSSPALPLSVLVVDDEPEILTMVAEVLRYANMPVFQASDAASALECLREHPEIGAMVSDIRMPGTDGIALLRKAMQDRKQDAVALAAVMMTGHAGSAAATEALAEGAVSFLIKPFGIKELLAATRKALEAAAARRAAAAVPGLAD